MNINEQELARLGLAGLLPLTKFVSEGLIPAASLHLGPLRHDAGVFQSGNQDMSRHVIAHGHTCLDSCLDTGYLYNLPT